MVKFVSVGLFILLFAFEGFSQTDSLNHLKYQAYKTRLKSQFMFFDDRNPYTTGSGIPASYRNSIDKKLIFGDATIHLANYLQVLATEFALEQQNHEPVDSTLHDLYLAIETFVRLDRNAEFSFREPDSQPSDQDINGFFIRDDVDSTFINKNQSFIKDIDSSWQISSDFIAHQQFHLGLNQSGQYNMEMSKDQCWHLYLAFAMISKFLDGVEVCDSLGNCYNFAERVRSITQNIQFQLSGAENSSFIWKLHNPVDGHIIPESRGGKVRFYSYGFGIVATEITGRNQHYHHSRSEWWRRAFLSAWKWKDWEADDFGARALSTVGDVRGLNDFKRLVEESRQKNIFSYPQFPLIHLLLFVGLYNDKEWQTADSIAKHLKIHLDEAPMEGPGYNAPHFWTTNSEAVWPERRNKAKPGDEFNGLDYMLFYNLNELIKKGRTAYNTDKQPIKVYYKLNFIRF